ncbi:MAG TPA: PqiC family protein [Syntrophobacter fumaroxidans]|nr:PqiC family protein [Syntrophobacter fumaroxidans]
MRGCGAYRRALAVFGLFVFLLAGCAHTPQSRFYLLQPRVPPGMSGAVSPGADGAVFGIGPVKFPEYLDRPQIVTRTGLNEIQLAEYHRWAEPLKDNFARVLTENLAALLPANGVVAFPWPGSARVRYQVVVEVTRFDGIAGREARLDAQWTIVDVAANTTVTTKKTGIARSVSSPGYEGLVAAQNEALGEFGAEIAATLGSLPE